MLNEFKIIIEYDGKQHFEPVRFNKRMSQKKALDKFDKQKVIDSLDKEFCKRKDILLYRL